MHNELEKYLHSVAHELRGLEPGRREAELHERKQHLEAIAARLMESGASQAEAVEAALAQFGPPHFSLQKKPRLAARWQKLSSQRMLVAAVMGLSMLPVLPVLAHTRTLYVPSGSMEPTIGVGTRIWVRSQPYKNAAQVQRGDVVVHEVVEHGHPDQFIKRVVGLPGDRIKLSGQSVWINGKLLAHTTIRQQGATKTVRETNGAASYVVQYGGQTGGPRQAPAVRQREPLSCKLSKGEFYLLGDNRDNALDSRYLGPITFSAIVAKYGG